MGLLRRKNTKKQHAAAELKAEEEALQERALRMVDTRGVTVRAAEAELQTAIANVRAYATPEREQRVADAQRALDEAKKP